MHNNSSGSVPHRSGKRSTASYQRGSNYEMQQALNRALARLGDPVLRYRGRSRRIKRKKLPLPPPIAP